MAAIFDGLRPDARILLIRLRSMGDCLLLTAPIHALKSQYPEFHITVLVEPRFAPCFAGNPDVDRVLGTRKGKVATIRSLVGERFDATVNLHGGPTSLAYTLAGGGRRIGRDGYQYRFLYSNVVPHDDTRHHTVTNTMGFFRQLGLDERPAPTLQFARQPEAAEWARRNVPPGPYAVIHPGAVMDTKRWAAERFAAIGRHMVELGLKPVLTVGPGEEHVVAETTRHFPDAMILLGLSIPQLAEVIRGAKVYVGNDSGPMHLAAAVQTPVVAVWGSSDSIRWRPWKVEHRVVQSPHDCNPCPGYTCHVAPTPRCIESVEVGQVEAALGELLPIPAGIAGDPGE